MTRLSVNLNKIALLRNSRNSGIPGVIHAAQTVLNAGAHGITVHPRPDGRHIRPHDVYELAELLQSWPDAEYNIEGNPFEQLLDFARAVRPHQCTLVPDAPGAFTSDHGWNMPADATRLAPVVAELKALGIRVSLFMDPLPGSMAAAAAIGADRVELYTESYASAFGTPEEQAALAPYTQAAYSARQAGLAVNAGHDLNRHNLPRFLRQVPGVAEVSIGHALIADALDDGLTATIRTYLNAMEQPA